jgi:hypothetical protein
MLVPLIKTPVPLPLVSGRGLSRVQSGVDKTRLLPVALNTRGILWAVAMEATSIKSSTVAADAVPRRRLGRHEGWQLM